MHTTNLRKVGGSVMLAIPPALLDLLKIGTGEKVDMDVKNGRLVIAPRRRPSYTLEELLAQCKEEYVPSAVYQGRYKFARADIAESQDEYVPFTEEREWLQANPVGKEIL